jgi:murein DD-endopeptidase MepM/ murein hydrolase activator NlpD
VTDPWTAVARLEREAAATPGDLYAALGRTVAALAAADPAAAVAVLLDTLPDGRLRDRLHAVDARLLSAVARVACGLPATSDAAVLPGVLGTVTTAAMFPGLSGPALALPLSMPGMPAFSDRAFDGWFAATGAGYGIGLYGEDRDVYRSAQFADAASSERRTIHLGLDVFAPAGTPVHAPLDGVVDWVTYNADPLDYGHTLLIRHEVGGTRFATLYGHLARSLPDLCRPGQPVAAGQVVAHLGDWHENGGWAAHLHLQVVADTLSQHGNFFGVGHASLWPVWRQISPDPAPLTGLALPP